VAGTDALTVAWSAAQAALPDGWQLEGLRCESTALGEDQHADVWVALATGPDGRERSARAPEPALALAQLVDELSHL
jgi:hypothetical protein